MIMTRPMIRTISTIGSLALFLGAAPATQPAACCDVVAVKTVLLSAPATQPAGDARDAAALFAKLVGMAGTWTGDAMGTPCTVEYTVTGGGSALVENTAMHGGMTTMYTLDHTAAGDRILMTHYCAAGNQPRMSATGMTGTPTGDTAQFKFVDATGMTSANDPHMHDLSVTFMPDGGVTQDWTMYRDGKEAGVVTIKLKKSV
jgi:hypothetical protein